MLEAIGAIVVAGLAINGGVWLINRGQDWWQSKPRSQLLPVLAAGLLGIAVMIYWIAGAAHKFGFL